MGAGLDGRRTGVGTGRDGAIGWFGQAEREIYALDTVADTGATVTARSVILPARPYQAMAELDPKVFRDVRKFVVGSGGKVLSYK